MRHRHGLRKLNVTSAHRQAKLKALCNALITHEAINTTLPKAKELRRVIEPLITLAAESTVNNQRRAFAKLRDRASVAKLFNEIGPAYKDRPGGYVRVLKNGYRAGDAAPMAFVELVDRKRDNDGDGKEPAGTEESKKSKKATPKPEVKAEEAKAEEKAAES